MKSAFVTPTPMSTAAPSHPAIARRPPRRRRARQQPTKVMTVHRINNPHDYAAALPKSPTRSPLVVMSYITGNCRACAYASHAYERLAREFATDASLHVRFCEMDVSQRDNQRLGQRLGVNQVPKFQICTFVGGDAVVGVLDELVGPRMVGKVKEKLALYLSEGFSLDDYVLEDASS